MIGTESPQQTAVYDAQDATRPQVRQLHLTDKKEIIAYVRKVVLSKEWVELMPPNAPTQVDVRVVNDLRLDSCASHRFEVPVVQYNLAYDVDELTILHELAHVAAGPNQGHRELFLWCFLRLVFQFMGTEAWQTLRAELVKREAAMP